MKQCTPCITIRTVIYLIYKNFIKDAYINFKNDYRSYSNVNAAVCELDYNNVPVSIKKKEASIISDIRRVATERYNELEAQRLLKEAQSAIQKEAQ